MCSPLHFIHIHKYYPNVDSTRVKKKHVFNGPNNVITEVSNALEGLIISSLSKNNLKEPEEMEGFHLG